MYEHWGSLENKEDLMIIATVLVILMNISG